ncbi:hypothetical protein [Rubellicoccus peritrichatus]|uniref:Uncharacterized protein n=1 Tax=Rubellicoccus peritrichatus TaxID=3080537 RepID=A0AAQ3QUD5_9BACT|nr:hypothetical protein [Puniceicoccus sp. CR14]WOO39825.1 hypothetical protein RZN69_14465 [Puniceicoccus sp. CR14]
MYRLKMITAALLVCAVISPLEAKKDLVQKRAKRIEFAEEQWQRPDKVTLNVHYRVPVIEVLGYLAANYDDPQKLNTIVDKLRPISNRVKTLSGDKFEGRSFPATLQAETEKLRSQMMSDVTAVYGSATTQKIESYLELKYRSLGGLFGPLN